jgi:hypothetical protein
VCPATTNPFPTSGVDPATEKAQAFFGLSAEDRSLLEAVHELAMTFQLRFPAGHVSFSTNCDVLSPMVSNLNGYGRMSTLRLRFPVFVRIRLVSSICQFH